MVSGFYDGASPQWVFEDLRLLIGLEEPYVFGGFYDGASPQWGLEDLRLLMGFE